MRYRILLTLCAFFSLLFATAQQKQNKARPDNPVGQAYAITSEKQGQFVWTEVKLIDLNTGQVIRSVFENNRSAYNVFNARTGNSIQVKDEKGVVTNKQKQPFSTFSAACAYDKKHNRLYYTPMFINELRYIDLGAKSPKLYYFEGENLSKATNLNDEANHITRMVIAADGNGYALSNDAKHFVKFTTGKKPQIIDLGSLQDDPKNGRVSVHNRCTSWGGDMVADASGNVYMMSAYHSIFKIDVRNKIATYLGGIKGLPDKFTTNGAVIDNEGNLIVSSANSTDGYYRVNMTDWTAIKISNGNRVFNASDLANGNLAFETKQERVPVFQRPTPTDSKISIYPNPVTEGSFRVSFDSKEIGRFDIQLVDLLGRRIATKTVAIANEGQVVEFPVNEKLSKGLYMVKVLNNDKRTVRTEKIIIE